MKKTISLIFLALLSSALLCAADHVIEQKDRKFSQKEIVIKVGDKLIFTNADEVTHNVYSDTAGLEFEIKRQSPGASSSVPFNKEGMVEVKCSIHPSMKLRVKIQK